MAESARETIVAELAAWCGIEAHYDDAGGSNRVAAGQTREAILSAMGYRTQSVEVLTWELERCRRPWSELVEPVLALSPPELGAGWSLYLPLPGGELPAGLEVTWELTDEGGASRSFNAAGSGLRVEETRRWGADVFGRLPLPLPLDLALGYYDLHVRAQAPGWARQGRQRLIVAPSRLFISESLANRRHWGLTLPLYALRRAGNWGIGDCGDLRLLLEAAGRLQMGVIGLNPLHHLGIHLEDSLSPYYPTSRCFSDPLFLDLLQVPEMSDCPEARAFLASPEVQARLSDLRQTARVQYPKAAGLKAQVVAMLLASFLKHHGEPQAPRTSRGGEFAAFVARQGESLQQFAVFLALSEHWRDAGRGYLTWQEWPAAYHDPRSPAVAEFARRQEPRLLTHIYAQWLLQEQLQEIQSEARRRRLPLGLYLDLAVGVNPGGFDTWANQDIFALDIDIGAPPDEFSPLGQNWGLAPLLPQALREQGYRYFIQMLRHNSLSGGALRIDHVMGLFRLYWIPRGATAAQGAYVRYAAEEMLKILALESHRGQTVIVGEDLGTVAPYIREQLQEYQVLSTRLFYFERQPDGAFTPAEAYPRWAQASITTHDLPTLAGFWQGRDIKIREELHLFPNEASVSWAWENRRRAKAAMVAMVTRRAGLSQEDAAALEAAPELPEQVRQEILAHLAQTPCRLALLSLEDIFGWLDQQNLPGTKDEYPNWRLKLPWTLEEIMPAPELERAARIMEQFRSEPEFEKE